MIVLFFLILICSGTGGFLAAQSFPADYPHYYNWSSTSNAFDSVYHTLPQNSRSLQKNFLTADPTEPWRSFSTSQQDLVILRILNDMNDGYFIDLATNDWQSGSNTYLLETFHKWKGICIEANPVYHEGILMNRKCRLFVNPVSEKNNEKVSFVGLGPYSGIVGDEFDNTDANAKKNAVALELTTVTLATILDFVKAPAIIHYLSLDIEGAEYTAMKGFDFSKYTIWTMTIERPKPKLHYLLIKHGYLFVVALTDYGETLYIHHSMPHLEQVMKEYYLSRSNIWFEDIQQTKKLDHKYLHTPAWTGNITSY